jgi:hypothetical protein
VGSGKRDQVGDSRSLARQNVHEAISAVVSDDHNYELGVQAAQAIIHRVLTESGPTALAEMILELLSQLAEAVKRIAADREVAAVDVLDMLFLD